MKFGKMLLCSFSLATLLLAAGADGGCALLDDSDSGIFDDKSQEDAPVYIVSIHDVIKYRRAEILEIEVESFFGVPMTVNKNYLIHSRDIEKIEPVRRRDNADFYDLKITLSDNGRKRWAAMSVMSRMDRKSMCLLIDGMYYRSFTPVMLTDEKANVVMIEGPFDPATTAGLVNNAQKNYKHYNRK